MHTDFGQPPFSMHVINYITHSIFIPYTTFVETVVHSHFMLLAVFKHMYMEQLWVHLFIGDELFK